MTRTVALLIESSRAYGRGLLRGIARYLRTDHHWSVLQQERALGDAPPDWLTRERLDGILARVESPALAECVRTLGVPAVDLRGLRPLAGVPVITTDEGAVARMAADHLIERGFRQFAFCGFGGADYSMARMRQFTRYLEATGHPVATYESPVMGLGADTSHIEAGAVPQHRELAEWLRSLPKPIGVMGCNDIRGRQVLDACREAGIEVPDEIAAIGVDNDDVLCDLSDPPMSSVIPDTGRIGLEAAALLDRMMRGQPAPEQPILIEPVGVITRRSTDVLAVEDPQVAAALRFIREHACNGINVEAVLDFLAGAGGGGGPVSRSTLDRRFHHTLGRSAKEEILRVRLARVRQLLRETDEPLSNIASMVGIGHTEHLSVLFKRATGETPGTFRRRMNRL
ncbi:MAG TPA: DNA-binding transcriptional regulator [Tepidisphaeraceae bacterium]|jgi:LacI family transcriptional regulator